jgi:hypothetical protein
MSLPTNVPDSRLRRNSSPKRRWMGNFDNDIRSKQSGSQIESSDQLDLNSINTFSPLSRVSSSLGRPLSLIQDERVKVPQGVTRAAIDVPTGFSFGMRGHSRTEYLSRPNTSPYIG